MKIVVDQMPDKPSDCPHSIYRDAKSSGWYGCSKRSIVCEIGKPGRECPIYIGLSDALKSMASGLTIKKGDAIFYLDDDSGEIEEGIVNTVHAQPFYEMFEPPSWYAHNQSREPAWAEYLMWDGGRNTDFPMALQYKYYNDPENDAEFERRAAYDRA